MKEPQSTLNSLRDDIRDIGDKVSALKQTDSDVNVLDGDGDTGEAIANVTLAFRHLEDARMRLGKAIQAYEGRASIYDSPEILRERADDLEDDDIPM